MYPSEDHNIQYENNIQYAPSNAERAWRDEEQARTEISYWICAVNIKVSELQLPC